MNAIYEPLRDFETQDLPERKLPFWKMVGPGAILVGLSIGAGEIIVWPRLVAEFGGGMVWASGSPYPASSGRSSRGWGDEKAKKNRDVQDEQDA